MLHGVAFQLRLTYTRRDKDQKFRAAVVCFGHLGARPLWNRFTAQGNMKPGVSTPNIGPTSTFNTDQEIGASALPSNTPLWVLSVCAFYIICALGYFVVPLTTAFGRVLVGTAVFPHDAVLNAGILEWGHRSLWSGRLFEWTAGYPLHNMLAGTENLIGWQLFYTPLRAIGVGVVAAYNILLIGSFVASALGTALLARRLGADRWGACAAGIIFAFAPFHLSHAMHLQTMAVCWSPFAVFFLDRLLERPRLGDWIGLVGSFTLSVLSAIYVGIFLAAVLFLYAVLGWAVGRARFHWRMAGPLACAGATALLITLPVLRHYVKFNSEHGFSHSVEVLTRFSLEVSALVKAPPWVATWEGTWVTRGATGAAAFPGLVAVALVLCFFTLRNRTTDGSKRKIGLLLGSLALVALVFALGPVLKLRGDHPSRIADWVPLPGRLFTVFSAIRWPVRAFMYSQLFGAVLAGLGLSTVLSRFNQRRRVVAVALLALLVLEYRPARWYSTRAMVLAAPLELSSAYRFLANESDSGGIVELPIGDSTGYRTPMRTRYTYGSAGHLRRVVAFHGSVHPPLLESLEASAQQLPNVTARRVLTTYGVTRLVVHRDLMSRAAADRLIDALRAGGYAVLHDADDAAVIGLRVDPAPSVRPDTASAKHASVPPQP